MVKRILSEISNAKNRDISPDNYESVYKFAQDSEEIAKAYSMYQAALKANNALDYDDLLLQTLHLLKNCAEAREFYQDKFRYIHIDEFQDTNVVQYDIAKILAGKHGNIFAVGDEDQCIYTWRGADIKNIFAFQNDCTSWNKTTVPRPIFWKSPIKLSKAIFSGSTKNCTPKTATATRSYVSARQRKVLKRTMSSKPFTN